MAQNAIQPVVSQADVAFVKSLEKLVAVDISEVDGSGRLRPVDPVAAEGIAASIRQHGLLNPIDVCRMPGKSGYMLVAGGHRLAAAELLGWDAIPAFVRSADALERKGREIAENLFKADLSPLDRAAFVRELIEVEKARQGIAPDKDGNALNSRNNIVRKQIRNDLCIMHKSLGLQETVAARIGLHRATVSRDLALNGIAPSLLAQVRASRIADNAGQLRALAKLHWSEQIEVLERLETGAARNVAQALGLTRGITPPSPDAKRLSTFLDTFNRMGLAEKRAALKALEKQLPKGITLAFGASE